MVSKLIWVCTVAYAMLLPCSGPLADAVHPLLVVQLLCQAFLPPLTYCAHA
jgi:hypothetical protein